MEPQNRIVGAARAAGFAAGWAVFTLLIASASRLMGWGPGFSNLVPYGLVAIGLSGAGQLARLWLGETAPRNAPGAGGFLRSLYRETRMGLLLFFRGTAACNNFLLLSLTYGVGIGLSSLFIRKSARSIPAPGPARGEAATYWRDLDLGNKEADAYYRPF